MSPHTYDTWHAHFHAAREEATAERHAHLAHRILILTAVFLFTVAGVLAAFLTGVFLPAARSRPSSRSPAPSW